MNNSQNVLKSIAYNREIHAPIMHTISILLLQQILQNSR